MSSVDFSGTAKGKFTLDNVKQFVQLDSGTSVSGIFNADLSFNGNKTAIDKKEYDKIVLSGTAGLTNLKYVSKEFPTGITIANYTGCLQSKKCNAEQIGRQLSSYQFFG